MGRGDVAAMEPAVEQRDDLPDVGRGDVLVGAAMEPAVEQRDDRPEGAGLLDMTAPQWSPPSSSGMTLVGLLGADLPIQAAMEPAVEQRDDPAAPSCSSAPVSAAMEPAVEQRDDPSYLLSVTSYHNGAAMEPAVEQRDDLTRRSWRSWRTPRRNGARRRAAG